MLEKNTEQVNHIVAKTLLVCSMVMVALVVLKFSGVFDWEGPMFWFVVGVGLFTTISPQVLLHLKMNQVFIKYYMLISMSVFVSVMGMNHKFGIYITFVLSTIVSGLYFDKKLTMHIGVLSYFLMLASVYVNSAEKLEIPSYGWTHFETFRAYALGFTLEFVVAMGFILQFVARSQKFMEEQRKASEQLAAEQIRYRLLIAGSKDVVFEYFVDDDLYKANREILATDENEHQPLEITDFLTKTDLTEAYKLLQDEIRMGIAAGEREFFTELEVPVERNGRSTSFWFSVESFLIQDEDGNTKSMISKLHDITRVKQMALEAEKRRASEQYLDNVKSERNSLFGLIQRESDSLREQDLETLAAGHRFIGSMLDELKYAKDLKASLQVALAKMGDFFGADRIAVIELDMDSGDAGVTFQWNQEAGNTLTYATVKLSKESVDSVRDRYDEFGYIEVNPSSGKVMKIIAEEQKQLLNFSVLGNQIWIPTLAYGEYNGVIYFDRKNQTPYSLPEKMLLSEAVSALSAYINRLSAENANEAKSSFLSSMSHEIRTPMNAIIGMAEVALRDDISESTRKSLNIIKSSSTGLLAIINDILDFSKIESGRVDIVPEPYEVMSLLNDVNTIVQARNKEKGLRLSFEIAQDIPKTLNGDVVRIKQIMVNLSNNAIKYTDQGSVTITVNWKKTNENQMDLLFSVKDTGMGIKKEDIGKLFQSFSQVDTTKNHHKEGTGLGLAICKQLVELMHGRVDVESEYGVGSTFSFVLPQTIVDETPAGHLEHYEYEEEKDDNYLFFAPTAEILVVDDTRTNLIVAKAILKPTGMQIDTAVDGIDALNKVQEKDYDLVLMDHFMPEMDGEECVRKIRELPDDKFKKLPIIALTADAIAGVKEQLIGAGMNDFLSKPIEIKTACKVIKKYLPQEKLEDSDITK